MLKASKFSQKGCQKSWNIFSGGFVPSKFMSIIFEKAIGVGLPGLFQVAKLDREVSAKRFTGQFTNISTVCTGKHTWICA